MESSPLMSIARIKEIYGTAKDKKSEALNEIKEKLNIVIREEDDFSNFMNALDHDYTLPEVVDCIIYYSTGLLCQRLNSYIKCTVCRVAFLSSVNESGEQLMAKQPVAILASEEGLIHPSTRLFNLLKIIERSFDENCKFRDVYQLVLNDVTANNIFSFPCEEHTRELIAIIIHEYLTLRMRELAKNEMLQIRDEEKLNAARKKMSRLCST